MLVCFFTSPGTKEPPVSFQDDLALPRGGRRWFADVKAPGVPAALRKMVRQAVPRRPPRCPWWGRFLLLCSSGSWWWKLMFVFVFFVFFDCFERWTFCCCWYEYVGMLCNFSWGEVCCGKGIYHCLKFVFMLFFGIGCWRTGRREVKQKGEVLSGSWIRGSFVLGRF